MASKEEPDSPFIEDFSNEVMCMSYLYSKLPETGVSPHIGTGGRDHPDVANSLNNLAALYLEQGRYADAKPLFKRSLAILEKSLGPDHPGVATALNNLAELYRDQGRYVDAEPLYNRSLAIWEKSLGPDHPSVATALKGSIEHRAASLRPSPLFN